MECGQAITFIVTLATTRCVTLAACDSGLSRKSAYALKARDPAFAAAWQGALNARPQRRTSGQVDGLKASPNSLGQGDSAILAAPSTSSTAGASRDRRREDAERYRFFARLADRLRSPSAAGLLASSKPLSL